MPTPHVLVVDDEPAIVAAIQARLAGDGLSVAACPTGEAALAELDRAPCDLLLLDIGLPGIDGFETLRRLRAAGHDLPVILLTARGDEIDRIVGLELGADDYVVKPFSARELAARVRVLLRRAAEVAALRAAADPAAAAGLQLDLPRRRATLHGAPLSLRPREFDLLAFLAARPGVIFSRDDLLAVVWGGREHIDPRTVDVHVRRLRAAIAAADPQADLIQTERGVGYRMVG